MSEFLEIALKAVKEAEKVVMSYYGKEKFIENKGEFDLVTKADFESEKKIVEIIKNKYPEHGFILEEADDFNVNSEYVWIVDPIDGTTSFAHNYPMFSISIALFKNKKPILGVVSAPYLKELFHAEKGKGTFLNNKKINVSNNKTLRTSIVATGFPYNERKLVLKYLEKISEVVQGIRRSGSAALDICYVATGRTDAYYELGLKIMDTAAAQLILKEAGGKVTDFSGKKIIDNYEKIVASNGLVHDELINILKGE